VGPDQESGSTRSTNVPIKDAFAPISVEAKPPYRVRLFRCYDEDFIYNLAAEVQSRDQISEDEFVDLWFHMDATED